MSDKGISSNTLIDAIRKGQVSAVTAALDDGADIEQADMHGQRGLPLRTACFQGNPAIVAELIRRGADINAAGADGPGMPLRLALRIGRKAIVAQLLKHGASIPDDVQLSADYLAEIEQIDITQLDNPAEQPTESVGTETEIIRNIEETRPAADNIGAETTLAAMDLLRFNDDDDDDAPGWHSVRGIR